MQYRKRRRRIWSQAAFAFLLLAIAPETHGQFLPPTKATIYSFVEDETGLPRHGINSAVLVHRQQGRPDVGYTARFVRNSYVFVVIRFDAGGSLPASPPPQLLVDERRLTASLHEQIVEQTNGGAALEQSILRLSNTAYFDLAHADTATINWGARRVPLSRRHRAPLRSMYDAVEND